MGIDIKIPLITLTKLETRYTITAKEINALFAKFGITDTVKENHNTELEKAKINFGYRDQHQIIVLTTKREDSNETFQNSNKFP